MKLHKEIKQRLKRLSQDDVIREMGYGSLKVGRKSLKAFLNTKNVYTWLKAGHFDLKYASESFLWKLVEVLDIPMDFAKEDIEKAKKRYQVFAEMKNPNLRAETNFIRRGESIFALMFLFGKTHIDIHKESLVYKTDEEIFKKVKNLIQKHYAQYKGELPALGKIQYYSYTHTDGKIYKLSVEGNPYHENQTKEAK